jgi:hypothetical protein
LNILNENNVPLNVEDVIRFFVSNGVLDSDPVNFRNLAGKKKIGYRIISADAAEANAAAKAEAAANADDAAEAKAAAEANAAARKKAFAEAKADKDAKAAAKARELNPNTQKKRELEVLKLKVREAKVQNSEVQNSEVREAEVLNSEAQNPEEVLRAIFDFRHPVETNHGRASRGRASRGRGGHCSTDPIPVPVIERKPTQTFFPLAQMNLSAIFHELNISESETEARRFVVEIITKNKQSYRHMSKTYFMQNVIQDISRMLLLREASKQLSSDCAAAAAAAFASASDGAASDCAASDGDASDGDASDCAAAAAAFVSASDASDCDASDASDCDASDWESDGSSND